MDGQMQKAAIKDLYGERKELVRNQQDTSEIDRQIDNVLGRVTLHKKSDKVINLFDGENQNQISKGGKFESEHGAFTIEDIDGESNIKVNGNWHHKSEFEPATVLRYKANEKSMER